MSRVRIFKFENQAEIVFRILKKLNKNDSEGVRLAPELKNLLSFHSWAWLKISYSVDLEKYHCTAEHDKSGIDTTVILALIHPRVYLDRSACHFPMIGNEAISLARM